MDLGMEDTLRIKSPEILLSQANKVLFCTGMITVLHDPVCLALNNEQCSFETNGPVYQALPSFLKQSKYSALVDGNKTPFQEAFKTDLGAYQWLGTHPENLEYLNQYMSSRRTAAESWLSVYPIEEETKFCQAAAPLFVNIGGGIGHQCAEFRKRYPNIPGKVILQDLSQTIKGALNTPGVENMSYDFFTPQPVQGNNYIHY